MILVPWILWLLMACLVFSQVYTGVVLDGMWRPCFRRADDPRGFWTIIAIQTAGLLFIGTIWTLIVVFD